MARMSRALPSPKGKAFYRRINKAGCDAAYAAPQPAAHFYGPWFILYKPVYCDSVRRNLRHEHAARLSYLAREQLGGLGLLKSDEIQRS